MTHLITRLTMASAVLFAAATTVAAQTPAFQWQKQLASGATVKLHNISGDVRVLPSSDGKVSITAFRSRGSDSDEEVHVEVHETSTGIVACVMWKDVDGRCDENGYDIDDDRGWSGRHHDRASLDLEVRVPTNVTVSASSVSGDVSVDGAQGDLRATSVSGDVKVRNARVSSLHATSVSGDIDVSILALTGSGSLEAKSVSGDVSLALPKNLDADLSLSTVSGELNSDFAMTLNGRMSKRRIEARIGKGGRDLDISTVSGDVRLKAEY